MSRRWPVARFPTAVLVALASAPLLVVAGQWHERRKEELVQAERRSVVVHSGGGARVGEVPRGMRLEASGFGTITDAPEVVAHIDSKTDRVSAYPPGTIAGDVRRFVRALPGPAPPRHAAGEPRLCTMEGPSVWAGRLVLIDGCLRIQFEGSDEAGPLILGTTELHRDDEGYLAASLGAPGADNEVRVGAPRIQFVGVGCSMDGPVPAPPALARVCGVPTMRRVGHMRRRHYCTPDELRERQRLEAENRAMQRRLAQVRQACLDRGTHPASCPPGRGPSLPPPPPPGHAGACVPVTG